MITRNTDYSIQRLRGLSTDTKPTDVPNGSEFREMDTGKKFLFSAAGTEWIEQTGSGGGGSGGGGTLLVSFNGSLDDEITADKTYEEARAAVQNGDYVFAVHTLTSNIYQLRSVNDKAISFSHIEVNDGASVVQEVLVIGSNNECIVERSIYPNHLG